MNDTISSVRPVRGYDGAPVPPPNQGPYPPGAGGGKVSSAAIVGR